MKTQPDTAKLVGRCSECGAEAWAWPGRPATMRHDSACSQVDWWRTRDEEARDG